MTLETDEADELSALQKRKRTEWLASRWLLHELFGVENARRPCFKDEHGKPYVTEPEQHISLSHSLDWVAAVVSKKKVGIDIQSITTKLVRIAPKFMRSDELQCWADNEQQLEHLHVFWGAKECLYKAYGLRGLDFRAHISVQVFDYHSSGGQTVGRVRINSFTADYAIFYQKIDYFLLVYAIEQPSFL